MYVACEGLTVLQVMTCGNWSNNADGYRRESDHEISFQRGCICGDPDIFMDCDVGEI